MIATCSMHDNDWDFTEESLDSRITQELCLFGMPPYIRGYDFIFKAIRYVYEDPQLSAYVTKDLYRRVARKSHTTASSVNRAVNHAIDILYVTGNIEELYICFGYNGRHPSGAEFIAFIARKLRKKQNHETAAD